MFLVVFICLCVCLSVFTNHFKRNEQIFAKLFFHMGRSSKKEEVVTFLERF